MVSEGQIEGGREGPILGSGTGASAPRGGASGQLLYEYILFSVIADGLY